MNTDQGEQNTPTKRLLRKPWRKKLIGLGCLIALIVWLYVYGVPVPLAKDEEMIAYFQENRAEIEELVRRYQNFRSEVEPPHGPQHWPWKYQGDTSARMERLGIWHMGDTTLGNWMKNPYSLATAQKIEARRQEWRGRWRRWHAVGKQNKEPSPGVFFDTFKYGVIKVQLKPEMLHRKAKTRSFSWIYGNVAKEFFFFPEAPRIEDGHLLGPWTAEGKPGYRERVFSSLNYYPSSWQYYECVYRPIDAHWFINLCR